MILGIDEVGRGCWAGPLVAGAVVLGKPIPGLADSKQLTKHRRDQLALEIERTALAWGLGWVEPAEVDALGLTAAVGLAMQQAYAAVTADFGGTITEVVIDGNINYLAEVAGSRELIKADATVSAVSAASILAKVARDRFMIEQAHTEFPQYGFMAHVGYGTAFHKSALQQFGPCRLHRFSYKPLKQWATV